MRERELEAKGYTLTHLNVESNEKAKEIAKNLRACGYKATVVINSRRGIQYYSVWSK